MEKKSIRRTHIIFALFILLISFTACGGPMTYVNRFNIKTSYKEWIKEIGLFSHKNIKVLRYNEKNSRIELNIVYENGMSGYEELCEIITAHNKFVDKNPDYFPSDIDICFTNMEFSEYGISTFYNRDESRYCGELGIPENAKLQYTSIVLNDASTELIENDNIRLDMSVIKLEYTGECPPADSYYEFLTEYKNAQKIILEYRNDKNNLINYDKAEVYEKIKKYLPDVEVYSVVLGNEKEEHLEKLQ